jgi:predicted nucleotidyltransferase
MSNIFIKPETLEQIRSIIRSISPNALVWAYGSRVSGDAHDGSDLDLAVIEGSAAEIKQALQESNVPFLIDVVDFKALSESFQAEIGNNYAVLYVPAA